MKPTRRRRSLILAASVILTVSGAHAQVFWDTDGTTPGLGTASGTWGTDSFWNNSATGEAGTFNATNATTVAVNFGNGATGLAAGTINVTGTVTSGNMTFASGSEAITLSGGTITLPAAATINRGSLIGSPRNTVTATIQSSVQRSRRHRQALQSLESSNAHSSPFNRNKRPN